MSGLPLPVLDWNLAGLFRLAVDLAESRGVGPPSPSKRQ